MITLSGVNAPSTAYPSRVESGARSTDGLQVPLKKPPVSEYYSPLDVSALNQRGASRETRSEEILGLIMATITVVADVVTLALTRAAEKHSKAPASPISLPVIRERPLEKAQPRTPDARPTSPLVTPQHSALSSKRLEAIRGDTGDITVRTYDGYIIRTQGLAGAWSISGPDGKTTWIGENAQVRESDGGAWLLADRSTFLFGAHKVTLESSSRATAAPVPSKITIYSGGERVTIRGLDTRLPTIDAVSSDGRYHDDSVSDGMTYLRAQTKFGESWSSLSKGIRRVMGAR
ncbi:MAG: hypothetical protein RL518_1906 [Pseudomonadota bacterium]|jgi:hypothetical protein